MDWHINSRNSKRTRQEESSYPTVNLRGCNRPKAEMLKWGYTYRSGTSTKDCRCTNADTGDS